MSNDIFKTLGVSEKSSEKFDGALGVAAPVAAAALGLGIVALSSVAGMLHGGIVAGVGVGAVAMSEALNFRKSLTPAGRRLRDERKRQEADGSGEFAPAKSPNVILSILDCKTDEISRMAAEGIGSFSRLACALAVGIGCTAYAAIHPEQQAGKVAAVAAAFAIAGIPIVAMARSRIHAWRLGGLRKKAHDKGVSFDEALVVIENSKGKTSLRGLLDSFESSGVAGNFITAKNFKDCVESLGQEPSVADRVVLRREKEEREALERSSRPKP